jgi:glutamate-1-semialdehyde 2,1-aminomutase
MKVQPGDLKDLIPGGTLGLTRYPPEVDFVVARGEGARIWSTDGKEFIDYVLGSGPMVIGHAHPEVVAAVREQVGLGTQFYIMNEVAMKLAGRIVELMPCAEAVKYFSDGAGATFYAMRLARAFTRRDLILKFDGGYHGHHDYAVHGIIGPGTANSSIRNPDSAGVPSVLSSTVLVTPFNDLEAAKSLAMANADKIAAIIVEPIQRALLPKPGFLAGLRALCDQIGALLIFDEVVTGFRVSLGGAQELYSVTPDLCALGKIVGGGLPLSAVAGRRDVIELTVPERQNDGRSVYVNGTLNGNPLAAAAGIAMIDVLVKTDGPAQLRKAGARLAAGFKESAQRLSIPFQVIGPPAFPEPIFGEGEVSNYAAYAATNRVAAKRFGVEMMKRGIYAHIGSKYYVSTSHTDEQIDTTCEAAYEAMRAVRDAKLLN